MSPAEEKRRLRRSALARRAGMTAGQRQAVAGALAEQALALAATSGASTVAAYASVGSEPGTGPALDRLRAAGLTVLLPVTPPATDAADPLPGRLLWARYEGAEELRPARLGLLEPAGERLPAGALALADVVLLPALLVDRAGTRLGRGAGYYDRALADAGGRAATYAVVHDDEVVPSLPREPHDVPVLGALTPSGVLTFTAGG